QQEKAHGGVPVRAREPAPCACPSWPVPPDSLPNTTRAAARPRSCPRASLALDPQRRSRCPPVKEGHPSALVPGPLVAVTNRGLTGRRAPTLSRGGSSLCSQRLPRIL